MAPTLLMMKRIVNLLRNNPNGLPITVIYQEISIGNFNTVKSLIKIMLHLNFIKYTLRKSMKLYYVNPKLIDIIDGREL